MQVLSEVSDALAMAGSMAWFILWPLVLGFGLSGAIQAVARREEIARLLPDDSPGSLAVAAGLGVASSSCSYAAVALARALFRKGANFTAALAFEVAATNLVVELGIILALLLGWQFTLAEFVGGPLMILFIALLFRLWVRGRIVESAREQADSGVAGSMEGHAVMDMGGPLVAVLSFVCSVGNVPLAGVLWNGGMSFGGVVSFVFADLIILPILLIYRRYYGTAMALRIFGIFYLAMAGAGYVVELVFSPLGLVPEGRNARVEDITISWNYTTWLNTLFLVIIVVLVARFVRTGGAPMLRTMGGGPESTSHG